MTTERPMYPPPLCAAGKPLDSIPYKAARKPRKQKRRASDVPGVTKRQPGLYYPVEGISPDDILRAVDKIGAHVAIIQHDLRLLVQASGDAIRPALEQLVDTLIDALDVFEPDPDLEPAGDEGDASYPENPDGRGSFMLVHPHEDDEDNGTGEPSLGSKAVHELESQQCWAQGAYDDREVDAGDDGIADADGLQEQTAGEPALGSFDRLINQDDAWQQRTGNGRGWWCAGQDLEQDRADHEPSLGWTVDGQHGNAQDREEGNV